MNDAEIGSAVRKFVGAWLSRHDDLNRLEEVEMEKVRAKGYRIVDGGQVDEDRWEVTDAKSGEVLARGVGEDSFEQTWGQQKWFHMDSIRDPAYAQRSSSEPSDYFGLPLALVQPLVDWVTDDPDGARQLIE